MNPEDHHPELPLQESPSRSALSIAMGRALQSLRESALALLPIALVIGTIGAVSVFYAVYVQKRELKCACVGGDSNVPLGAISLTENLMMIAMGLYMPTSQLF